MPKFFILDKVAGMSLDKPLLDQIIDQSAHMLWAGIAITPTLLWQDWWAGALSGLLIGAPRELWDQRPRGPRSDWWLDLIFFGVGGAIMGWFLS